MWMQGLRMYLGPQPMRRKQQQKYAERRGRNNTPLAMHQEHPVSASSTPARQTQKRALARAGHGSSYF